MKCPFSLNKLGISLGLDIVGKVWNANILRDQLFKLTWAADVSERKSIFFSFLILMGLKVSGITGSTLA